MAHVQHPRSLKPPQIYNATIVTAASAFGILAAVQSPAQNMTPSAASPLDLVNGLHTAFGEHHARAVHTKGIMVEGSFTPAPGAANLTREPIFRGGSLPVVARFSNFAGVPDLADNDDGASPAGLAVKIKEKAGTDFDVVTNQHPDFISPTSDEFVTFLRAAGAAGKGDSAPLEAFLASHPHARQFLGSRTYPVSYAQAPYFGINSVKFTNAEGKATFLRYRFVPRAQPKYLTSTERKARGSNYLQEEIAGRFEERCPFWRCPSCPSARAGVVRSVMAPLTPRARPVFGGRQSGLDWMWAR